VTRKDKKKRLKAQVARMSDAELAAILQSHNRDHLTMELVKQEADARACKSTEEN